MSGARRHPDWFERHDAEIRELAWLGAVAGAPHPSSTVIEVAQPVDGAPPGAQEIPPEPEPTAEHEALRAAEQTLAEQAATIEQTRAELAAAHEAAAALRTELEAAREEMLRFASSMREDAETELVKLALSVAERVVARELQMSPELVVEWAREAIGSSDLGGRFIVATSSDIDEGIASSTWGELEASVRMDPALPPATCEIRDSGRMITVSAEARLDIIADNLAATKPKAA